jgi:ribosomal protein S27AE
MTFDDLSADQKKKFGACRTPEEVLELAKAEGYELSDKELGQLAGGGEWRSDRCPKCGSYLLFSDSYGFTCRECGYVEEYNKARSYPG